MHALIVVSHPLASSLTHRVAHALAEGITSTHSRNSADIADLTREGFNPVFNESDYAAFMKTAPLPPDVAREQARIDNADALVRNGRASQNRWSTIISPAAPACWRRFITSMKCARTAKWTRRSRAPHPN